MIRWTLVTEKREFSHRKLLSHALHMFRPLTIKLTLCPETCSIGDQVLCALCSVKPLFFQAIMRCVRGGSIQVKIRTIIYQIMVP